MARCAISARLLFLSIILALLKRKIRKRLIISILADYLGDPFGARTQDPNIKSVVLYQLS